MKQSNQNKIFTPLEKSGYADFPGIGGRRCRAVFFRRSGANHRSLTGFTLMELMIVVIIIGMLAGLSVGLMNIFSKGSAVKNSSWTVEKAINDAAQYSRASGGIMHFVVFSNAVNGGEMTLYKDKDGDRIFAVATDEKVHGNAMLLSPYVRFRPGKFPAWIGIERSGRMRFPVGYTVMNPGPFENGIQLNTPDGDIVLEMFSGDGTQANPPRPYKFTMFLNLDDITGKVRKSYFFDESQL